MDELDKLKDAIEILSKTYLPDIDASVAIPSDDQQERTRAFVVLAHAEMEWFVEKIAERCAETLATSAQNGRFSTAAFSLISFSNQPEQGPGGSLGGKKEGRTIAKSFWAANARLVAASQENNGIREKHLAKLLVPLGLGGRVDAAWLGDIDSFAEHRGRYAHMSMHAKEAAKSTINPQEMLAVCRRIINGSGANTGHLISSMAQLHEALNKIENDTYAIMNTWDRLIVNFSNFSARLMPKFNRKL